MEKPYLPPKPKENKEPAAGDVRSFLPPSTSPQPYTNPFKEPKEEDTKDQLDNVNPAVSSFKEQGEPEAGDVGVFSRSANKNQEAKVEEGSATPKPVNAEPVDTRPMDNKPEEPKPEGTPINADNIEPEDAIELLSLEGLVDEETLEAAKTLLKDPNSRAGGILKEHLQDPEVRKKMREAEIRQGRKFLDQFVVDEGLNPSEEQLNYALEVGLKPEATSEEILNALKATHKVSKSSLHKGARVLEPIEGSTAESKEWTMYESPQEQATFSPKVNNLEQSLKQSNVDLEFITGNEGGIYLDGYHPGEKFKSSGITVGAGVDLGQTLESNSRFDSLRDTPLMDKIRPFLAIGHGRPRGREEAMKAVEEHGLPKLTPTEAYALTLATKADMINRVRKYNPEKFDKLDPAVRTALVDTAYHGGNIRGIPLSNGTQDQVVNAIFNHSRFKNGRFANRKNSLAKYLEDRGITTPTKNIAKARDKETKDGVTKGA